MKKIMVLLSAVAISSCTSNSQAEKAIVPAINSENLDLTKSPSDDFYAYTTAGWQKNNPLKDEYARFGSFDVLRENNEHRIKELFTNLGNEENAVGSVGQKITDLYNLGLDSTRLNSEGATPIKSDIDAINNISDRKEFSTLLGVMHKSIGSPFFGIYVDADIKNSSENILYIGQSGLCMGTKDYYINKENEAIREAYKKYITELFTLAAYSAEDAAEAANSVFATEMAIATASKSNVELRDPIANYNMFSREDFEAKYSAIDWDLYAKALGLSFDKQVNVGQVEQLSEVNKLFSSLELKDMKYYFVFNLLNSAAPYLSDDFIAASFDFYGKTMSGKQTQQPRWKRALAVPNSSLSEAVGQMYVAKYFPAEHKAKMLTIVKNLQSSLSKHIAELDWMSDATKAKAQEKLSTFYVKIGYPDKWKDYTTLQIDPKKTYWANVKDVNSWQTADNLSNMGKKVDKDKWYMSPQTVNAYYNPASNEICFPAAILQPPFFNPDADDAVNYGAIGVVIGHEMTHGFDDQGRQFDKDGNLNDWWTKEDADKFKAKTDVLVEQFNSIEVLPNVFANGEFTLGENIADQGGLRVSYTAMKESQKGVEPAEIDGFTASQRFYIGYASVWAQNIRNEEIARLTNIDPHSLGENRVNQTLKNIDTFYDAFNIKDGKMFLAPEKRVIIW